MQNDLLCLKLCYCFGVSEQELRLRFGDAMEIADEIGYFKSLPHTRELRTLYRVIFGTIRSMDKVKDNWQVQHILGAREAETIKRMGLDFDTICQNAKSLDFALQIFITMANSKLPHVYQELQISLPYAMFELLLKIRNFTLQELPSVQYMLKRQTAATNVYFSNSEILNVSVYETLRSDATVLKRLRVLCGDGVPDVVIDNSELGKRLKDSKNFFFVRSKDLDQFETLIFDASTMQRTRPEEMFMEHVDDLEMLTVGSVFSVDEATLLSPKTVVISRDSRLLGDKRIANLYIPLPIARGVYKKVLKGMYPHASFYVTGKDRTT